MYISTYQTFSFFRIEVMTWRCDTGVCKQFFSNFKVLVGCDRFLVVMPRCCAKGCDVVIIVYSESAVFAFLLLYCPSCRE